jgi:hypothetical protein
MEKNENRRDFLKAGALVDSGVLLGRTGVYAASPQEERQKVPANDTLRTIQSLRTIHSRCSACSSAPDSWTCRRHRNEQPTSPVKAE